MSMYGIQSMCCDIQVFIKKNTQVLNSKQACPLHADYVNMQSCNVAMTK